MEFQVGMSLCMFHVRGACIQDVNTDSGVERGSRPLFFFFPHNKSLRMSAISDCMHRPTLIHPCTFPLVLWYP